MPWQAGNNDLWSSQIEEGQQCSLPQTCCQATLIRLLTSCAEEANASSTDAGPEDIRTETVNDTIYKAATSFEDLRLPASLLQGLYTEMNFQMPSRIQAKTLPMILTPPFESLIAQARHLLVSAHAVALHLFDTS